MADVPPSVRPAVNVASLSARFAPFIYAGVALLYWASLYTYVPTLPTYAASLTDDLAAIGLIIAMYGLWQALLRLPVGIMADWAGRRKPFIILGLVLSAAGALLMGSAHSVDGLLVGRSVTGLAAATWVPLTVVFSALYPPEQAVRATTVLTLMSAIARLLATAANGPLNAISGSYSLAFTVAATIAVFGILLVIPAPEPRRPVQAPAMGRLGRLITRRDVLLPALLSALAHYVVQSVAYGFIPLLARDLAATNQTISLLTVLHLAVLTPATLLAAFLLRRFRPRPLVVASFVMMAAGVTCAALASTIPWLVASQTLIAIGYGVAYPMLMGMSIENVDGAERTTAMGLHQSVYAIGMFAGPWFSGMIASQLGMRPMFAITAAGTLIVGVLGTAWATSSRKAQS